MNGIRNPIPNGSNRKVKLRGKETNKAMQSLEENKQAKNDPNKIEPKLR